MGDRFTEHLNILNNYITIDEASNHSGYSKQYIRRLLRRNRLEGEKLGNIWLIKIGSYTQYCSVVSSKSDDGFGARLKR